MLLRVEVVLWIVSCWTRDFRALTLSSEVISSWIRRWLRSSDDIDRHCALLAF